jgi:hypothetical protein
MTAARSRAPAPSRRLLAPIGEPVTPRLPLVCYASAAAMARFATSEPCAVGSLDVADVPTCRSRSYLQIGDDRLCSGGPAACNKHTTRKETPKNAHVEPRTVLNHAGPLHPPHRRSRSHPARGFTRWLARVKIDQWSRIRPLNCGFGGGRYWDRTSDLFGVNADWSCVRVPGSIVLCR